MAFKLVLVAALVSSVSCAYPQQESAAAPGQIAFAQSQDYDQTGPGAKQTQPPSYLQYTQQQPGVYATFPREFTQSSHPQDLSKFQGFGQQQQHFAKQSPFPQPQTYTLQQSEPQVPQYSGPSQLAHAQPPQIQYSAQPQHSAQPQYSGVQQFPQYSGPPQAYSQAPVSYQVLHQQSSQFDASPQQYSFNAQDALNNDAKIQLSQDYNGFQQQSSAPKGISQQQPQPPAYVAPKVRANQYAQQATRTFSGHQLQQQTPKIPQQYYTTSHGTPSKPLYASPVSKFASPSGQHFQFSR